MDIVKEEGHGLIDKKLGRIERWLKRCAASCGCGAWSSALMDIECLQAEAREFREELWAALENNKQRRADIPAWRKVFLASRIGFVAMLFVLMTGFPLSVDQDKVSYDFWAEGGSIALLTSTESEIINGLRNALSRGNRGRVVVTVDVPERPQPTKMTGVASASGREPAPTQSRAGRVQETKTADVKAEKKDAVTPPSAKAELSVEDVVSLVQIGQRALMTSDSAIEIVKQ